MKRAREWVCDGPVRFFFIVVAPCALMAGWLIEQVLS